MQSVVLEDFGWRKEPSLCTSVLDAKRYSDADPGASRLIVETRSFLESIHAASYSAHGLIESSRSGSRQSCQGCIRGAAPFG